MRLEFESNVSTPSLNENGTVDSLSEIASSQVKNLLQDGIKAAQSGNRAEARHLLLRVTELEPQNENAWLWLASISEYPEELLIFLNNVLDVNPNNQRALEWMKATKSLLAKTFVQRGIDATKEDQKTFAKQCFFQAVGHDDQNEMAWLWLASVSDLAEEKKSYLDKVLAINPDNEAAHTALQSAHFELAKGLVKKANALAAAGKTAEAGEMLEEIFQKAPDLEDAWLLKSHLTPSFDEKIKCFEKVLELDPTNETAKAGLDSFRTIMQIAAPQVYFAEEFAETENTVQEELSQEPQTPIFAEEVFSTQEPQFVEETICEPAQATISENQFIQEEVLHDEELAHDNNPTQELELPEAIRESNPFESQQFLEKDDISEEVDAFFDALEENRKTEEPEASETSDFSTEDSAENKEFHHFVEESETDPVAEFEQSEQVEPAEEKAIELSGEENPEEYFTPQHSFDTEEAAEESVQFSEGVENDDFEIVEESVDLEVSAPQSSPTSERSAEDLYYQEFHAAEAAAEEDLHHEEPQEAAHFGEETAHENNFQAEFSHSEEASLESQPTESHSQSDTYSYQNFTHIPETHTSEHFSSETFETTETAESENGSEQSFDSNTAVAEEEEEVSTEEPAQETIHTDAPAQFYTDPETDSAPEQTYAEETNGQVEETQIDEDLAPEPQSEPVAKAQPETATCPYCNTENEVQAFACSSCRAVLSLSDLEVLLSNQGANEVLLHQAVSRMELEKNLRPFNADELLYLGIGYINLKNLRQGFAYLQEAAQMRPDDFLLNSQVNALTIRVAEIKQQEEIQEAQPKGRTILVVDDSATVRKLISGKLEKSGHEVVCAVDGMDALAKLNEIVPDLILLDITMPRMDGYQVCKLIRNNQATKDIPVVMISGKDGFFDKVRGRMAGTTGYITKPFGPETLMKALDAYIRNDSNGKN